MNERKITEDQIDDLFLFCEENDVKYYDVQMELVDHLSCAIESKWKEKPELAYEEALWEVYEEFGASGFRKISSSKEKELEKKFNHLRWQYIGQFFRLPKIMLTISATTILFVVFQITHFNFMLNFGLLALFIATSFAFLLFIFPKKAQLNVENGKSFVLLEQFIICHRQIVYLAVFPPLNAFIWGYILLKQSDLAPKQMLMWELAAALFYVFLGLVIIVYGFYLPKRIKEDFTREFPQFVKS
jgi:hypothetical protein